jgi:hypothetical protein
MIDDLKVAPLNAAQQTSSVKRFAKYATVLLLAFVLLNALAVFALPQDKFLRYQAPLDPQSPTAPWIYQRIHFDPTPIDVAFIGSSRTGLSVHTGRLEAGLAQHDIHLKAANIYMVRSGLNMQYVLAKELLNSRKVKLLVLEMTEREERKPHDDFIYLADPLDVIAAPMLINFNYLSDLARLPGRQVNLFWDLESQELGLHDPKAAPQPYEGSNLDHAEVIRTIDGINHYRDTPYSLADMEKMRIQQDREITPSVLPRFADAIEYRLPRYYENKILDLAKARGTTVVFLYTPRYGGPENPPPYQRYADRAGLINPWPAVQDYTLWWDANHLNWEGAKLLTDYVVEALAAQKSLITAPST